jgi:hypothetical protein
MGVASLSVMMILLSIFPKSNPVPEDLLFPIPVPVPVPLPAGNIREKE